MTATSTAPVWTGAAGRTRRPLVAIPARFSESASALRFRAEVNAHKLIESVYAAGGEPLTIHPSSDLSDGELDERLAFVDAVLLPGGGDLHPSAYGGADHPEVYDTDTAQDGFDIAVARWAQRTGRPLLAICRGLQVVNVSRGGTLIAHLDTPHRHVTSTLTFAADTHLAEVTGRTCARISCFHHQAIERLGDGLRAVAISEDGVIEAVEAVGPQQHWFLGIQWHPEDTAGDDPAQQAIFTGLVQAAAVAATAR